MHRRPNGFPARLPRWAPRMQLDFHHGLRGVVTIMRVTLPAWRTRVLAIVLVLLASAVTLILWRRSAVPAVQHGICRDCNVLLITIDTLRADRVGAFGGPAGLTPVLDRLASDGLRLTRAYTVAPLTLPAHTSILTAVSPPVHGVRTNGLFRLGPKLPTLTTVLKEGGYRTGAFVGAFVLDARFGLNRGFDVYDDRYGEKHPGDDTEGAERRAEDVIRPATGWITEQSGSVPGPSNQESETPSNPQAATGAPAARTLRRGVGVQKPPWFAWVHLYDPHEPYRAPEPYASRFAPYDAEVAYTDAMLGKLLADLRAARQLDHTLVLVAGDHGESLGERGERSHGVFAYEATLHIPWIVWAGARLHARAWDGVSRLIDLAPTVLDLIGRTAPSEFEGRSLVDALAADETASPPAYFEAMDANLTRNWAPLTGIVSDHQKLIDLPRPELYDLRADPQETSNLFGREGERARTLQAVLQTKTKEFQARGPAVERTTLSADARQRLQALGYVASSAEPGTRTYTDVDDPKTLIGAANDLNRALADFKSGSTAGAISAVREIIRVHPTFTTAYGVLASMQHDMGDLGGAIATLDVIARRGTADQSVMLVLAGYLQEAGALAKAAELLQAVVAAHPDYADAHNSLGVVYSRMGRHHEAQAAFRHVLELDPTSATAFENIGVDAIGAGDAAGAVTNLTRALELDPRLARAHNALAAVYMRQRREAEALSHWQTALQLDPHLYDALYNVGISLWDAGRLDEARPYLDRFAREAPAGRYAADLVRVRNMLAGQDHSSQGTPRTQRIPRTQR
jgi:arylsulfatase A-like enzyme/Flp pilus assembly protein TadD